MKRLAFIRCDNGFRRLIYLDTNKYGSMLKKQDIELKKEIRKNGNYDNLEVTYIDTMVNEVENMLYLKKED